MFFGHTLLIGISLYHSLGAWSASVRNLRSLICSQYSIFFRFVHLFEDNGKNIVVDRSLRAAGSSERGPAQP